MVRRQKYIPRCEICGRVMNSGADLVRKTAKDLPPLLHCGSKGCYDKAEARGYPRSGA
jgi:uncharacterized protein (DUF779 family)